ncbi:MAG TPA: nucleoside triphosphate pyrophosphatase [Dongiaceae bacterium]|nr:nucleoside triphosphate pyrophosphatase [Dongiaceae bacterium]
MATPISSSDTKNPKASRPLLVLASASPRRLDLLRQIGLDPDRVDPPEIDESHGRTELPRAYARRMAAEKLTVAAARHPGALVVAADTVVACGRRILPKAETADQARACLHLLGGRRHQVWGGIAIALPDGRLRSRVVVTDVSLKRLEPREIENYIDSGEWQGKAGGYAIQGRAAVFISAIAGSYSNVVGLSLSDLAAMLHGNGIDW